MKAKNLAKHLIEKKKKKFDMNDLALLESFYQ